MAQQAESYNFRRYGAGDSSFVRKIDPALFEIKSSKKLYPEGVDKVPVDFSIQTKWKTVNIYEKDGTAGGRSLLLINRPKGWSSKSFLKLDASSQAIEFKRPKDTSKLSNTRSFEYEGTQYRWEMHWSKAKLKNHNTGQVLADFIYHQFRVHSQGNLIIYEPQNITHDLKLIIIASGFEMILQEKDRNRSMAAGGSGGGGGGGG